MVLARRASRWPLHTRARQPTPAPAPARPSPRQVDAKHVVHHLDEEKPEGVVNEAVEQIAYADRIVLNKTDLVCGGWGSGGRAMVGEP